MTLEKILYMQLSQLLFFDGWDPTMQIHRGVDPKPGQPLTSSVLVHHVLWHIAQQSQKPRVPSG